MRVFELLLVILVVSPLELVSVVVEDVDAVAVWELVTIQQHRVHLLQLICDQREATDPRTLFDLFVAHQSSDEFQIFRLQTSFTGFSYNSDVRGARGVFTILFVIFVTEQKISFQLFRQIKLHAVRHDLLVLKSHLG